MRLAELQDAFAAGLRSGAMPADLAAAVVSDRIGAVRRLQVHRNHVRVSLGQALATHYPVVARMLGPAAFEIVAARYLTDTPPRDPRLALYGAGFAATLAAAAELADWPFLAPVAAFEWARHEVALAAPARALTLADLAGLAEAELASLRLRLLRSARLVEAGVDVGHLWQINQPGEDGTPRQPLDRPCRLALWRDDAGAIRALDLDPAALAMLRGDRPLGALFETLGDAVATALARLVTHGLIDAETSKEMP